MGFVVTGCCCSRSAEWIFVLWGRNLGDLHYLTTCSRSPSPPLSLSKSVASLSPFRGRKSDQLCRGLSHNLREFSQRPASESVSASLAFNFRASRREQLSDELFYGWLFFITLENNNPACGSRRSAWDMQSKDARARTAIKSISIFSWSI